MRMHLFLLTVAIVMLATVPSFSQESAKRFVQDRFAIGFWVDPPSDQITDARYKEIAEANFTFVMGNFGPQTDKDISRQLSLLTPYISQCLMKSRQSDSPRW